MADNATAVRLRRVRRLQGRLQTRLNHCCAEDPRPLDGRPQTCCHSVRAGDISVCLFISAVSSNVVGTSRRDSAWVCCGPCRCRRRGILVACCSVQVSRSAGRAPTATHALTAVRPRLTMPRQRSRLPFHRVCPTSSCLLACNAV